MARFTTRNYEEWDFRHTRHDDPKYDVEADVFLSGHYTTVVAVDLQRLQTIAFLIDKNYMEKTEDGKHARFTILNGAAFLGGMKSGHTRLTRTGRFNRRVLNGLRREYRKHGQVRLTILPH